ncbi:MAG TPA: ABC transporter ATP-binding protein [Candidatus Paceibacterota bacterium]|nr:ABC transporter ATP-binding protein [Candidatus Paceibacterota bacterium]
MPKQEKKRAKAGAVFRAYFTEVRAYPGLLSLIILGGVGIQLASLAAPWYLRNFFNILATTPHPDAQTVHTLGGILAIVTLIYLGEWAARRVQGQSNNYFTAKVMTSLYSSSFSYLIGHSYNFFVSHFAGSLTHKLSKYVRSFEMLFDNVVISFFPTFLFVAGAVTVLFMRSHMLGIALAVWAVCFITFQVFVAHLRQPVRIARSEAETRTTAALADAVSNQATIDLFSGKSYENKRYGEAIDAWRKASLRSWMTDDWIWAGIGLFMTVIEIGLLYGGVLLWQEGLLTIGDFVLIQSYLLTTFDRLVGINRELRRFYDAFADASEMVEILITPHEIRDKKGAQALKVAEGQVSFRNVQFRFHDNRSILEDFTLSIAPREKIALVGPSGAGKTTITKLLLRLYDLKGGSIEVDGQNIADVTQESLRDAISFVPQEPILFHRTLMENIRYGRRDASDEEVIEAARKAHCHEFIAHLPEGYNTFVGERGIKLSGGERQRVAIARAILKDAPILVLDEATSSLDSESEALIQDALEVLMRGKTVIVIAHRLSTIMKMDRIVVLENGKVVASGTHEELLQQKGLYHKLWSIQAGGFIIDDDAEAALKEAPEEEELAEDEK